MRAECAVDPEPEPRPADAVDGPVLREVATFVLVQPGPAGANPCVGSLLLEQTDQPPVLRVGQADGQSVGASRREDGPVDDPGLSVLGAQRLVGVPEQLQDDRCPPVVEETEAEVRVGDGRSGGGSAAVPWSHGPQPPPPPLER